MIHFLVKKGTQKLILCKNLLYLVGTRKLSFKLAAENFGGRENDLFPLLSFNFVLKLSIGFNVRMISQLKC